MADQQDLEIFRDADYLELSTPLDESFDGRMMSPGRVRLDFMDTSGLIVGSDLMLTDKDETPGVNFSQDIIFTESPVSNEFRGIHSTPRPYCSPLAEHCSPYPREPVSPILPGTPSTPELNLHILYPLYWIPVIVWTGHNIFNSWKDESIICYRTGNYLTLL